MQKKGCRDSAVGQDDGRRRGLRRSHSMAVGVGRRKRLGVPRHIVSPLVIEIVIQKHGREETKIKGPTGFKLLDDLPRRKTLFV